MKLRIGTRTSKMAMAQAKIVAAKLRALQPDLDVEFVGISSQGDRDKKTPLWQMDTVGIFSRDLDEKLLGGEVDCTVHSLKDLGTQRPNGLSMTILKRENPRDIVVFRTDVLEKIKNDQPLIIGSCAPRRTELVPAFLTKCLPQLGQKPPVIEIVALRGNVNTRLKKLRETNEMDGIIVALGGLGRLNGDDEAHEEFAELFADLKFMVLPLTEVPGAPGQGTIVVETQTERIDITQLVSKLKDTVTTDHFARERKMLVKHGGGCHQKFGVVCVDLPNIAEPVLIIRGSDKAGNDVSETIWNAPQPIKTRHIWDGTEWMTRLLNVTPLPVPVSDAKAIFVSHHRACPDNMNKHARIWVSGTISWEKLAAKGLWVEGCADGFGFEFIKETLAEPLLKLPPVKEWTIYTHQQAIDTWDDGHVVPTYTLTGRLSAEACEKMEQAELIWWGSAHQYALMKSHAPKNTINACGAGKTADALKKQGISNLHVFPHHSAFLSWAGNTDHDKKQGNS
jgi:hydroxymethylbilane synthase